MTKTNSDNRGPATIKKVNSKEKKSPFVCFEVNLAQNFFFEFKQKPESKDPKKENKFHAKSSRFLGIFDILSFVLILSQSDPKYLLSSRII